MKYTSEQWAYTKKSQNANWLDILLLLLLSRPDLSVMLSERIAMAYVIGSERTSITFYRNIFHVFPVVPFSHFPSCALQCHSQWNSTLHHRTSINSGYTDLIDFYDCRTSNRYKMASMNGEYSPGRPVIPSGAREPGEPTAFRTSCKNFFKIKRYFKLFRKCYFISSFSFMPISFTKCYVFRKHKNLCLVFVVAAFFTIFSLLLNYYFSSFSFQSHSNYVAFIHSFGGGGGEEGSTPNRDSASTNIAFAQPPTLPFHPAVKKTFHCNPLPPISLVLFKWMSISTIDMKNEWKHWNEIKCCS